MAADAPSTDSVSGETTATTETSRDPPASGEQVSTAKKEGNKPIDDVGADVVVAAAAKKLNQAAASKLKSTTSTKLQDMEKQAVDRAKATADAAFRPPEHVMNADNAKALLTQVDGPSLETYEGKESVYVGRSVPISAGSKLTVPIHVMTPGSVLEYNVEVKANDISFSIAAEREEGNTVVRAPTTIDTSVDGPVSQKFLVGSVPCLIQFTFDNEFSWFREKVISYRITVTPPSRESLAQGRRRRAKACLKAVEDDLQKATNNLHMASNELAKITKETQLLVNQLSLKKEELQNAEKKESFLTTRKSLRTEQQKLLRQRLDHGWDDEKVLQQQQQQQQQSSQKNGRK